MSAARWQLNLDGGEGAGGTTEALVAYGYGTGGHLDAVAAALRGHGLTVTSTNGVDRFDVPDTSGAEPGWAWTGVLPTVFVDRSHGWIAFVQGKVTHLPATHGNLDAIAARLPKGLATAELRIGEDNCADVADPGQRAALHHASRYTAAGVGVPVSGHGRVTAALAFPDTDTAKLNAEPRAAAARAAYGTASAKTAGSVLVLSVAAPGGSSRFPGLMACPG